jgi:hypothetical protein
MQIPNELPESVLFSQATLLQLQWHEQHGEYRLSSIGYTVITNTNFYIPRMTNPSLRMEKFGFSETLLKQGLLNS